MPTSFGWWIDCWNPDLHGGGRGVVLKNIQAFFYCLKYAIKNILKGLKETMAAEKEIRYFFKTVKGTKQPERNKGWKGSR